MLVNQITEATYRPSLKKNSPSIEPWKYTFKEYMQFANPHSKHHDSGSYQFTVDQLNQDYQIDALKTMKLLGSKNLKGIQVDFYGKELDKRTLTYAKDFDVEKVFAKNPYEYSFKAVDHDTGKIVGIAQDEWGALLIAVAMEYQNLGIGPVLGQYARSYVPHYDSGGTTSGGHNNLIKVYSKFVSDAMREGKYVAAVKSGEMSVARAKEIIASASLNTVKSPLKTSNEWKGEKMLLANIHGMYIIYDSKLLELHKQDRHDDDLAERFVYGAAYAGPGYHDTTNLRIFTFGGKSEKIKRNLMNILLMDAGSNDENVIVPDTLGQYVDDQLCKQIPHRYDKGVSLYKPLVKSTKSIDGMISHEKGIRKPYDQYDEFSNWLAEKAVGDFEL